jgi:hypothetical protein
MRAPPIANPCGTRDDPGGSGHEVQPNPHPPPDQWQQGAHKRVKPGNRDLIQFILSPGPCPLFQAAVATPSTPDRRLPLRRIAWVTRASSPILNCSLISLTHMISRPGTFNANQTSHRRSASLRLGQLSICFPFSGLDPVDVEILKQLDRLDSIGDSFVSMGVKCAKPLPRLIRTARRSLNTNSPSTGRQSRRAKQGLS